MNKLISVIVPSYNVEKWIRECIDSISQQTYIDLEIIIINDGSTDNTQSIIEELSCKDKRIIVHNQKNQGVSAARNRGVELATGDYITFIDADDVIHPDMLMMLFNALVSNDLDIVSCDASRTKELKVIENDTPFIISGEEALSRCLLDDFGLAVWGRLYKRHIAKNVKFPEGRKFEDSAVGHLYFLQCSKIGCISSILYYYRKNPNSICQTSFRDKDRYDYFLGEKERYDFAKEYYPQYEDVLLSKLIKAALSCLTAVFAADRNYKSNRYYNVLYPFLRVCRQNNCDVSILPLKYRFLFHCVGFTTFFHIVYAKGSLLFKHGRQRNNSFITLLTKK